MAGTTALVMLPAAVLETVGRPPKGLADLTALLDEWATLLDPVRAIRDAAASGVLDLADWHLVGRAEVDGVVKRFAREAAKDEAVVAAVAASPLAGLVSGKSFREQALPLILGLGVIASVRVAVCLTAADIRKAKRAEQDAAQRRSDSEASEQRPELEPLLDGAGDRERLTELARVSVGSARLSNFRTGC